MVVVLVSGGSAPGIGAREPGGRQVARGDDIPIKARVRLLTRVMRTGV